MKKKFLINVITVSCLSVIASKGYTASSDANKIKMLEERITVLEHHDKVTEKTNSYTPVIASPQLNLRKKYNTAGSYNNSLAMLKLKKQFEVGATQRQIPPLPYPRIEVGGSLNAFVQERRPPIGSAHSNLNLSGATINVAADMTSWLLGYINIAYDPNPSPKLQRQSETLFDTNAVANSNIYLSTGFLVFGDLTRFPLYATLGQNFLPFGEYITNMFGVPLTARLGRMRQRSFLVGFQEPHTNDGFNASVFVFTGNTKFANRVNIKNGGANAGYVLAVKYFKLVAGASFIANIADSGGMQESGPSTIVSVDGLQVDDEFIEEEDIEEFPEITTPVFTGFNGSQVLVHRVPGADLRAKITFYRIPVSLITEFNQAIRTFAPDNMTFNDRGAQPATWHNEVALTFHAFDLPGTIAVSYDHTREALALNLPKTSSAIALGMTFNNYISGGLEYRYDKNYQTGNFATGQNLPVIGNNALGKTSQSGIFMLNARF